MKLHLPKALLTAVLAVVGGSSVYATTTVTGGGITLPKDDDIIFKISANPGKTYFSINGTVEVGGDVQIGEAVGDTPSNLGMYITDGNSNSVMVFTGTVTGSGMIHRTGNPSANPSGITFTGDMTAYTGSIYLGAVNAFTLTLGGNDNDTAVEAASTSSTKGVAGTGNITIANANNKLVFNYGKNENSTPVYITNAISEEGTINGSTVTLKGGADYIFSKNVTVDNIVLDNGSLSLGNNVSTASVASAIQVSSNGLLVFDNAAADTAVTITNSITKVANSTGSTVTLKGGADYIFDKNVTVDNVNLEAGSLSLKDCNNGTANVQSAIKVSGGAKLIAGGNDKLGWGAGATKSITLAGTSDKKAIFELGGRQTMATELHMDGNAIVTASGDGSGNNQPGLNAFRQNGAIIDVTGTNNEIAAALQTRGSFHITVAKDGELLVSGIVRSAGEIEQGKCTYDTDKNPNGYEVGSIVKLGEGKITFSNASNVFTKTYFQEAGETVISAKAEFQNGIKITGGEFTLNADITLGSGKKIELTGGTLNLGGSLSNNQAVQFLTGTTGGANITVKKDITLSNGAASQAKGKLTVENATLTLGSKKDQVVKIESFNDITLDGGTIKLHAVSTKLNNVSITENGGTLKVDDMQDDRTPHLLSGETTIAKGGTFTIETSWWRQNTNIALLTGEGDLLIKDSFQSTNKEDDTIINISELKNFSGGITVDAGTDDVTRLNVTAGEAATLTGLTLKNGADMTLNGGNLTVGGNLEMSSASGITLDKDATINLGSTVSVKGVSSESTNKSQIVRITDAGGNSQVKDDTYSSLNTTFSIKNAHVTVSSATDINLSNKLDKSAITNNGTGTVNLVYGASDRTEVNALKGNINIMWMNDANGRTDSLTKLEIGDNLTVAAQVDGSAIASITNLSTLKVTKTAIIGSNATVKANLTLTDGATLTLSGFGDNAATINGNLTLGAELKLAGEEFLEALGNLESGEMLKILNVEGAFSGLEADLSIAADAIIEEQPLIVGYTTSNYYSSLNVSDYALIFQGTELFIKNTAPIPEPTTATLSLLALAALAARRRRK